MTPEAVDTVVEIYLDRQLSQRNVITAEEAEQLAQTIEPALDYMTEKAKKSAMDRLAGLTRSN